MKILVINGPNMNMLGIREPDVYGRHTYADLCEHIKRGCEGEELDFFQSNHEGAIVDRIHAAYFDGTDGIVINPAAHTHYSYAIHDAVKAVGVPTVEVHISSIGSREEFRHTSVIAPACRSQICGKGFDGYVLAVKQLVSGKFEDVR